MDQSKQNNARTIVVDTARLLKQNKLTKEDLAKMDKTFREEVTACASTMLDQEQITLNVRSKEKQPLIKDEIVLGVKKPKPLEELVHAPAPIPAPAAAPAPKPEPKIEPKPKPKPVPPPPPPPPAPMPKPAYAPAAPLTEEQLIQIHIDDLRKKREMVSASLHDIQFERNVLLKDLESIRTKEKGIEQEEAAIKKEQAGAVASVVRTLEEKRWALEDARQVVEKERWEAHKKLDAVDVRISETYKQQAVLDTEELKSKRKIEELATKREAALAEGGKSDEEKVFAIIQAKKKKFEADWVKIKENIKRIKSNVSETDTRAVALKKQIEEIEAQENVAISEQDRHTLEEKRWLFDKQLRDIEKMVWDLDAEVEAKLKEVVEIEKIFAEIQIEEEKSKEKISAYLLAIKRGQADRNS